MNNASSSNVGEWRARSADDLDDHDGGGQCKVRDIENTMKLESRIDRMEESTDERSLPLCIVTADVTEKLT